jgi:hypothetical protein
VGDIEFWVVFIIGNSIKSLKMILEGNQLGNLFTLGATSWAALLYTKST